MQSIFWPMSRSRGFSHVMFDRDFKGVSWRNSDVKGIRVERESVTSDSPSTRTVVVVHDLLLPCGYIPYWKACRIAVVDWSQQDEPLPDRNDLHILVRRHLWALRWWWTAPHLMVQKDQLVSFFSLFLYFASKSSAQYIVRIKRWMLRISYGKKGSLKVHLKKINRFFVEIIFEVWRVCFFSAYCSSDDT